MRFSGSLQVMAVELSDNLIFMRRVTATELARTLSDLLDAVEHGGESLVVVRQGREVARIEPVSAANGSAVKALLQRGRRDAAWAGELAALRSSLGAPEQQWAD
jgi:prevent-host-death family protein